MKKVIL